MKNILKEITRLSDEQINNIVEDFSINNTIHTRNKNALTAVLNYLNQEV